ncbi:MAG: hypothetical protein LUJ09_04415, partial [Firmicutes bacterium]|nr:hypothetical protein [Bacillota bacterium]
ESVLPHQKTGPEGSGLSISTLRGSDTVIRQTALQKFFHFPEKSRNTFPTGFVIQADEEIGRRILNSIGLCKKASVRLDRD